MINNRKYIIEFRHKLVKTISGKGDIMLVAGEQGFGKSHLVKQFSKACNEENNLILNIIIENEEESQGGTSQKYKPLLTIEKALESILKAKNMTAKKKLAVDMTLTSLSMIPIFGDFVYGVKELSRDWRRYKDGKSDEGKTKGKSTEYLEAFKAKSITEPFVLFFENMHTADATSERFLQMLASDISDLPILLVITYNPSKVAVSGDVMYALSQEYEHKTLNLEPLIKEEISEICKRKIDNYTENHEFLNWFQKVTSGIPGEIVEFLDYFKINQPFDNNGNLKIDLSDSKLPSNAGSAFKETLKDLSKEEIDTLLCAASIGRDFSVSLLSELTANSPLQITKIIREINLRTGEIRSLGAFENLGIKSTVYRFNENTFYRYLLEQLEYEEIFELNARISDILKLRLNSTDDEEAKEEIATKLLKHSKDNDDKQNIDLALNQIKHYAEASGDTDLKQIISKENGRNKPNVAENSDKANLNKMYAGASIDYKAIRNLLTNNFNNKSYDKVIDIANDYFDRESGNLSSLQNAILKLLQARAELELKNYDNASKLINNSEKIATEKESKHLECLVLNSKAILHFKQNHYKRSINLLQKASEIALELPGELRVLTLANIAKVLSSKDDPETKKFEEIAQKLQDEYALSGLV